MKIGLAQINPTIGDFSANLRKIVNSYRDCIDHGAELVISPELGLTGYPPMDLIYQTQFTSQCQAALEYLAKEITQVPLLVGYIEANSGHGKPFRNAVALLSNGKIQARIFKTLLPSYDVFDEGRWFEPAESNEPIIINGKRIGITICEDIWEENDLEHPLYVKNPLADLVNAKIDLLVNLSASPFSLGKFNQRKQLLEKIARHYQIPIAYCNQVGANDELIFDGNSLCISSNGQIIGECKKFQPDSRTFDLPLADEEKNTSTPIPDSSCEMQDLFSALVLGLRDYATKTGFSSVCLGLSGGIDSALTAVIAKEALGAQNVLGLTMPSMHSSSGSVNDSIFLAKKLGIRCETLPIKPIFDSINSTLAPLFEGKKPDVTEENIQARIRGLLLMAAANKFGHLLLTTGNKSELAVGYCTIYGDMCGGLAVISDLPKTVVYELSRWINQNEEIIPWETINKAPSAELRPDQKDSDSLPPYEILDAILELLIEKQISPSDVIKNYHFDESMVYWIKRRIDMNEWKRHQAAPGLRVTNKAFGLGRRMPIAHRFGE